MKYFNILLCVLFVVICFLCLSSCNNKNNTESSNVENTKTEYTVVDTTIETTTFDSNNTTTTKTTVSDTTAESTLTETIVTETTATETTATETTATETIVTETTATETTVTETTATITTTTETTATETTATETTATETTATETTTTETIVTETTATETATTETTATETIVTETTATETTVTETTKSEPLVEHFYPKNQPAQFAYNCQKYKNRIYLFGEGLSRNKYYDRYNDTMMSYCSDPLCDHSQDTCILRKFLLFNGAVYNSYNDRIYIPSGDNIYSFKSSGVDLRLDVSFGDNGKIVGATGYAGYLNFESITFCDEYLFFTHCELIEKNNPETGEIETNAHPKLYKYNTITKKLNEYSISADQQVRNLIVLDYDRLGFSQSGSNGQDIYYIVDFNFNVIDIIEDEDLTFVKHLIVTDDDNIYVGSGKTIIKFNKKTFEKTIILETDKNIQLFDIDQGYIYYTVYDPFYVGSEIMHNGKVVETYNTQHTLYRLSVKDGKTKIIYEGITSQDRSVASLQIQGIIVLNDRVYLKGIYLSNYYDIRVTNKSVGGIYPIVNGKIIVS